MLRGGGIQSLGRVPSEYLSFSRRILRNKVASKGSHEPSPGIPNAWADFMSGPWIDCEQILTALVTFALIRFQAASRHQIPEPKLLSLVVPVKRTGFPFHGRLPVDQTRGMIFKDSVFSFFST